jgi:hypothetical protein
MLAYENKLSSPSSLTCEMWLFMYVWILREKRLWFIVWLFYNVEMALEVTSRLRTAEN